MGRSGDGAAFMLPRSRRESKQTGPRMAETLYEGPAHDATFHLTAAGIVRFAFGDPRASRYVRSPDGHWHGFSQEPG